MTLTPEDLSVRAGSTDLVRRSFQLDDFEFRDNSDTGGWTFEGVASVVDFAYPVRDKFGEYTETIKRGAFDTTLRDPKAHVSLYVNHQHSAIALSATSAGMALTADPHLRVRAELNPKRPDVQNVRYAIEDGVLREMSIGFSPVKARDKWNDSYTDVVRTQVSLREVSIVELGANIGGTTAAMRSFDDFMSTITDTDMSEDEVRRAIAYFESRLPEPEQTVTPEIINPFAERDRMERERLERIKADRPPAFV